ncbi:unnamed protein product [Coffea canephora]|uniref:Uncharacterized protein n=1 Tax=Coffea canephora TaxID=49390 RepID=A0A068UIA9_COFCA|nr:unnamed protein product [Coffea canephora]
MVTYHIWVFHQIVKRPTMTIIGINAINCRFWVQAVMKVHPALLKFFFSKLFNSLIFYEFNDYIHDQFEQNNIMASTLLASMAIMTMEKRAFFDGVCGGRYEQAFSVKFISILVCFLVAFLMTVQSIRYYSHANILINVLSFSATTNHGHKQHFITPNYFGATINWGSYFWLLGLRTFYFSFPLFFWIFGHILMFLCCILLVFLLYFLDVILDFGWVGKQDENHPPGTRKPIKSIVVLIPSHLPGDIRNQCSFLSI